MEVLALRESLRADGVGGGGGAIGRQLTLKKLAFFATKINFVIGVFIFLALFRTLGFI